MDLTTTTSIQSIIEQGLQQQMSISQEASLAQLNSTQAALVADGRVDAVIANMSAAQAWNIDDSLLDSTDSALGNVLGSTVALSELMSNGIVMVAAGSETTVNEDGTVTVTRSVSHAPGVAMILDEFTDQSVVPAQSAAGLLAASLSQQGSNVADNMSAFASGLVDQIDDFVTAGLASSALGAGLVINLSAYY
ncbi:hypothetical protein EZJ19_05290 [Parasulfuritortus cantonensis]|uniref:Uncharacterized protein n=1 Tax=Parasulfuritortus cantonensis TaxID=2528202 RepID=A0A4R1BGV4_9PROT|nr:hypothetical protein [Parasulfuritortus cantonensis]TCJ16318.1 hypothetical protein EZJ19_05290 [Parasulfuritortus cantonensis]